MTGGTGITAMLATLLLVISPAADAGRVSIPGFTGGLEVAVESFQARKFSSVFRQQYDFSCGSAAIASLLTFHYQFEVSEADVFSGMFAVADPEKVQREGFSMLDMKHYLESEGYQADGFRLPLDGLRKEVRLPVIALVTLDGYRHFVIIKGISADEVLVGDPARGMKVYPRSEFEQYWDGTAFVIRSHLKQGRNAFITDGAWPSIATAPLNHLQDAPPLGHTLPYWPSMTEW
ncbi:MAG: C39 family peptidase [Marinobacter sp.]|uniref:C39 family peptidase n=1 Tax=uncultured Marinobacter sp. TaxID=187379 RepID=UPI001B6B3BB7|nr:C39 family peptidase [Marinobacter sp.]|tara:strand:+ start:794 stop:1492 length:699 start_codon:yes stop_codon:yes gene_type:complete